MLSSEREVGTYLLSFSTPQDQKSHRKPARFGCLCARSRPSSWIRENRIRSISLASRGWFAGIEKKALPLGDYSVAGLEDVCVVERKDLSDLVHSCTADRMAFVKRLRLMAQHPHRLLVVTSTLSQMKSPYTHTNVDPNRTMQFLVATLAGRPSNPQTWNRYAYALNNPLNIADPTGLYNTPDYCRDGAKLCEKDLNRNREELRKAVDRLKRKSREDERWTREGKASSIA
jgi:hypothetical protein